MTLAAQEITGSTRAAQILNSGILPKGSSEVSDVHEYLDSLPETGKVLSIDTAIEMLRQVEEEILSDNFELSVLYRKLPDSIKEILVRPYLSDDGNQVRFAMLIALVANLTLLPLLIVRIRPLGQGGNV